jgi:flagellar protein FlgJ
MDINALGGYYFNQTRLSLDAGNTGLGNTHGTGSASLGNARGAALAANPAALLAHGPDTEGNFAAILEKAMTGEAEALSPGAAAPGEDAGEAGLKGTADRKPRVDKDSNLYEQCEALETFLIKNLLTSMRNTVQKSGLLDEGFAGDIYEDMLYDEYAKSFSKNANFGLAELAYLELTGQRGKIISR